jgi:hypothetical protein
VDEYTKCERTQSENHLITLVRTVSDFCSPNSIAMSPMCGPYNHVPSWCPVRVHKEREKRFLPTLLGWEDAEQEEKEAVPRNALGYLREIEGRVARIDGGEKETCEVDAPLIRLKESVEGFGNLFGKIVAPTLWNEVLPSITGGAVAGADGTSCCPINALPEELLQRVLALLSAESLLQVAQVDRRTKAAVLDSKPVRRRLGLLAPPLTAVAGNDSLPFFTFPPSPISPCPSS